MDWLFEDLDFTPSDTERLIVGRSGPKNQNQSVQIKKKKKKNNDNYNCEIHTEKLPGSLASDQTEMNHFCHEKQLRPVRLI